MFKKRHVLSLHEMALNKLNYCIIYSVYFLISIRSSIYNTRRNTKIQIQIINQIQLYLERNNATPHIYQQLLNVMLLSNRLTTDIKFICLRILLNNYVNELMLKELFLMTFHDSILQFIANSNVNSLQTIYFDGLPCNFVNEIYFLQIIENNRNLKELKFAKANDKILKSLAINSKHFERLTIVNPVNITSDGVQEFCTGVCRDSLTNIDIGFNFVPQHLKLNRTDIVLLLLNLLNLEMLRSYVSIGSALLFIHECFNYDFKTKLKHIEDTTTNSLTIDAIIKMCPNLENIYLSGPDPDILYKLNGITNLKRFKLHGFSSDLFMRSLHFYGQKLQFLEIVLACGGTVDIGKIALYCPNLLELKCDMIDSLTYDRLCNEKFKNLQIFKIHDCSMATIDLLHFLCNTFTLTKLFIGQVEFTDDNILSIFIDSKFQHLKEICFEKATFLTIAAVKILIEHCPALNIINKLSQWENVTESNIVDLIKCLKHTNASVDVRDII